MSEYLIQLKDAGKKAGKGDRFINALSSYATILLEKKLPVIFDNKHLALLIGITLKNLMLFTHYQLFPFYREISIPKKNGGTRSIKIPCNDLKYIQRWILDKILVNVSVSNYATGFRCSKSILTNANFHIESQEMLNLDLKDFFPSISEDRVFRLFSYLGYTNEVSYTLSRLCTYKGQLPQGSPSSPYISNIVCKRLDKRLSSLSKAFDMVYSRYADDLTFSGKSGTKNMIPTITLIIEDEGFNINNLKTRFSTKHERMEVTGLTINSGVPRVRKEFKRKLNQEIYYCKKFGAYSHMKYAGITNQFYKEHLYGKAYFVKMIEPELGKIMLNSLDEIQWDY